LLPSSPRALLFSLRGTVPVLDLGGERIVDSTKIIEALEQHYPEHPLYPPAGEDRRRALELEEFFDEQAGHELRRAAFYDLRGDPDYVSALLSTGRGERTRRVFRRVLSLPGSMAYANRRYRLNATDAERARAMIVAALDRIVAETGRDGYLVGSRFSVADLTAAALLFPLAWPAELQYDYPDPPNWPLMRSLQSHPAVDWIRGIYSRHRGRSMEIARSP
jgi:glutathione S-transferase